MGTVNLNGTQSKLWALVEKEGLADIAQFHRRGFFDEVPLYAQEADVAFLRRYGATKSNEILLRFALGFLHDVISHAEHRNPFFAAITLWDHPEDELIVPNLFVCCGNIRRLKTLELDVPTTTFARKMKRSVGELNLSESMTVREDTTTLPDTPRVFIAPQVVPYQGFVTLERFRKSANHV